MGKDQLKVESGERRVENTLIQLVAEEGASLSSGSLHLYARLSTLHSPLSAPLVGRLELYSYDPLNRRCAVGIMVATEYRRQGYALAMLHALEAHFSPTLIPPTSYLLPLHTLYADIAATNAASLSLFRKAGYTECGRFKEWLNVNDKYIDSIRMQKILS